MEGYPGNTGCNSDAFIGQAEPTGTSSARILRLCVTNNVFDYEVISIGEVTATAFSCSASSFAGNLGVTQSITFVR